HQYRTRLLRKLMNQENTHYITRVCVCSNNGDSDCAGRVNDADCGRDVPAPQCPWFAMRPQSQAEHSQTVEHGGRVNVTPVVIMYTEGVRTIGSRPTESRGVRPMVTRRQLSDTEWLLLTTPDD